MMHKDLSDYHRQLLANDMRALVEFLMENGQSLALAREALPTAFDKAAEELALRDAITKPAPWEGGFEEVAPMTFRKLDDGGDNGTTQA